MNASPIPEPDVVKLIEWYDTLADVIDRLEDEGDRCFLGSTNDRECLVDLRDALALLSGRGEGLGAARSQPGSDGGRAATAAAEPSAEERLVDAVLREVFFTPSSMGPQKRIAHGKIYGDRKGRFEDGEEVHTSYLVSGPDRRGVIRTRNSIYRIESYAEDTSGSPISRPSGELEAKSVPQDRVGEIARLTQQAEKRRAGAERVARRLFPVDFDKALADQLEVATVGYVKLTDVEAVLETLALYAEEIGRLTRALDTPELHDFARGVVAEAQHARFHWKADHDIGKQAEDWFWLVGYLAGKALRASRDGDTDKALHHTISTAAALANWHAAISGANTEMRPGIDPSQAFTGATS